MGLSLSSLEHRVTLARRVARCPELGRALEEGEIGYEAALLIGRVLGPSSSAALVEAWIGRARVRTYKHLREEVDAVLFGTSLSAGVSREPPGAADLEAVADLQRRVQSGEIFRSLLGARSPGPQTSVTLATPANESIRPLRLTLPIEVHEYWQQLESRFSCNRGLEGLLRRVRVLQSMDHVAPVPRGVGRQVDRRISARSPSLLVPGLRPA